MTAVTRYLLVPGRGKPMPEHWLQRWVDADPRFRWAPAPTGPPYILDERVAALHEAVVAEDGPAILVAHSAGCLTVAWWARRHTAAVRAALLVAPPYIDPAWEPDPDEPVDVVLPGAVPRGRLPFPAILVASRTDPHSTYAQSAALAGDWGAELVDAGDAGHIDTRSGYGPWPAGERRTFGSAARSRTFGTPARARSPACRCSASSRP
jgi:predicted alpha/beta hydrolase family esterase